MQTDEVSFVVAENVSKVVVHILDDKGSSRMEVVGASAQDRARRFIESSGAEVIGRGWLVHLKLTSGGRTNPTFFPEGSQLIIEEDARRRSEKSEYVRISAELHFFVDARTS